MWSGTETKINLPGMWSEMATIQNTFMWSEIKTKNIQLRMWKEIETKTSSWECEAETTKTAKIGSEGQIKKMPGMWAKIKTK